MSHEQLTKIRFIEQTLFRRFSGVTSEEAQSFIREYHQDAVRLSHTQGIEFKRKSRTHRKGNRGITRTVMVW